MHHWFLAVLFIVGQFAQQHHVLAEDPIYECYAFSDPHIHTWRLKTRPHTPEQYQDCYRPGRFELVRNEFIRYSVQTSKRWMTEIDFWFYDGTSKIPFCLIHSSDYEVYPDDEEKCNKNGVMWKLTKSADEYVLVVNYFRANFSTTIQHGYWSRQYSPHFNIHAWQTESLVSRSSGLCKQGDSMCKLTSRTSDSESEIESLPSPKQILTINQAHDICQSYIDAYLNQNQRKQRSIRLKTLTDRVMDGCVEDVMFTGIPEIARSSLSVLMIEELTSGVQSIDGIQPAIEAGIQEAFTTVHDATEEAKMRVSRLFDHIVK